MNRDECTITDAREALHYLSPDCSRDEWVEMGMAVKSEFGEDGRDVWMNWSSGADSYKESDAQSTWKSIKQAGPGRTITIASLFKAAIDKGWRPNKAIDDQEKARRAAEAEKRSKQRAAEREREEAALIAWQARAADCAVELRKLLQASGKSEYLDKKGVRSYGLRFAGNGIIVVTDEEQESIDLITGSDDIRAFFAQEEKPASFKYLKHGTIAVPMIDQTGQLWNHQFIFPSGKKSFLKFGRKQGCWHVIGQITPGSPIAFAEGYATGATIHEATSWPCVVTFDCGNLKPVAQAVREKYPDHELIICGDDDVETKDNPGRTKATEVASLVSAKLVFPVFESTEGPSENESTER